MRRLIMLTAMVLVAVPASAQVGGGLGGMGGMGGMGERGGRSGGRGGMGGPGGMTRGARTSNMKYPTAKSLEAFNPADALLDKHKKLKLTDMQQDQLKGLRQQIFERNAPMLASYDALQRDFRPHAFDPRGEREQSPASDSVRRTEMMQARQLRLLVDSLMDRRRADVHDVLSVMADESQRKQAAELLDKQDVKFDKEFPSPPAQRAEGGPAGDGSQRGPGGEGRSGRRPPA